MKIHSAEEVLYFAEILVDHLKDNYPLVTMSKSEIMKRSTLAADEIKRDDLTTNQATESAFQILLRGFENERPSELDNSSLQLSWPNQRYGPF